MRRLLSPKAHRKYVHAHTCEEIGGVNSRALFVSHPRAQCKHARSYVRTYARTHARTHAHTHVLVRHFVVGASFVVHEPIKVRALQANLFDLFAKEVVFVQEQDDVGLGKPWRVDDTVVARACR